MPDQNIIGLPPGATVTPIQQSAPQNVIGLPAGATVTPIQNSQDPEAAHAERAARSREKTSIDGMTHDQLYSGGPAAETGLRGVATGVGKEEARTIAGAASLANKVLPNSLQIPKPDVEPTAGLAEGAGGFAENLAEFAGGEELLKSIGTLAHIGGHAPQLLELMEKYPKASKLITGMLKAGTIGGAQGGVKGAATDEAASGAESGAIGGAVGGAVAEGVGAAVKPLAKSVGLGTSAEEDIVRAVQPGKRNYRFLQDWAPAADKIHESLGDDIKFENFDEAAKALRQVKQGVWQGEVEKPMEPYLADTFDTQKVVDKLQAARNQISPSLSPFRAKQAKVLDNYIKLFKNPLNLGDAQTLIGDYNAELDSKFYDKTPDIRAALERTDPEIKAKKIASDAMRDEVFDYMDSKGVPSISEARKTYGALGNLEREIRGQANVTGRQRPLSLKQIIALTHGGPVGIVGATFDKIYNAPTALLNRALAKSAPQSATGKIIEKTGEVAGAAGKKAIKAGAAELGEKNHQNDSGPTSELQPDESWIPFEHEGQNYMVHPEDLSALQERGVTVPPQEQSTQPEPTEQNTQS